jgi:hypothetical protein
MVATNSYVLLYLADPQRVSSESDPALSKPHAHRAERM